MRLNWEEISWKKLVVCIAIPLLVGGLSAFFSGGMDDFGSMNKPSLSPPGWLFPVVWTILYTLMGIALAVYGVQLVFNFFWSIIFFRYVCYWCAFIWLLLMELFIILTTLLFGRIDKRAAYLMIPYILWVAFAGYLNLGIAILN